MVLNLSVHAERDREEEYHVSGHLQAHDEPAGLVLALHQDDEEADEADEDAAEDVKADRYPSVGDHVAEGRIGPNREIVEELLAQEVFLVAGAQRNDPIEHIGECVVDGNSGLSIALL